MSSHKHGQWTSQLGFLLSALGSAIGLGNIWRFAYLAHAHGGGTFVFAYVIALFCIGIPLLALELGIGHSYKISPPEIFKKLVSSAWIGWLVILLSVVLTAFYPVILAWCSLFFVYSFNLEWGENTESFFVNDFLGKSSGVFDLGNIQGDILLAVVAMWVLTWFILFRGVKGLELANKICMPLLFIFISILVVWSMTLDGAWYGLQEYFTFKWDTIWHTSLWVDAVAQVFFSLSIGYGCMMVYASYLDAKSDITKSSIMIGGFDSFFAIFAGIVVFAVLGFMATQKGIPLDEVMSQGPGLAFVVYTQALNIMASSVGVTVAKIFGIIFFSCLVLAGLSSLIGLVETYANAIIKKYNTKRGLTLGIAIMIGFLTNLIFTTQAGYYWLDLIDHFVISYGVLLTGALECVVIGWILGAEVLRTHVNAVSKIPLGRWWNFLVKLGIPLFLCGIFLNTMYTEFQVNYGGYPTNALLIVGMGGGLLVLFVAWILSKETYTYRR